MTETDHDARLTINKKYSTQEKRNYYTAWQNAGMSKAQFCKEQGLSIDHFHYWCSQFKKQIMIPPKQFVPIVAKASMVIAEKISVEMRLPNQVQLLIPINHNQLISFIQELCCAITVIR